jgi:hypothetical protein
MIFLGQGDTNIPCFRTVKEQGGTAIAIYKPGARGAKEKAEAFYKDGRVRFVAPGDYSQGKALDEIVLAVMARAAAELKLALLEPATS